MEEIDIEITREQYILIQELDFITNETFDDIPIPPGKYKVKNALNYGNDLLHLTLIKISCGLKFSIDKGEDIMFVFDDKEGNGLTSEQCVQMIDEMTEIANKYNYNFDSCGQRDKMEKSITSSYLKKMIDDYFIS